MIHRIAAIWHRLFLVELPLGRSLYMLRYGDLGDDFAEQHCVDGLLSAALRTAEGEFASIDDLSFEERRIILAEIVKRHSHLQGVSIFGGIGLRAMLPAIRSAPTTEILEELARRFIARRKQTAVMLYLELRASAAAIVA